MISKENAKEGKDDGGLVLDVKEDETKNGDVPAPEKLPSFDSFLPEKEKEKTPTFLQDVDKDPRKKFMFWVENFCLSYKSNFPSKNSTIPGDFLHGQLQVIENLERVRSKKQTTREKENGMIDPRNYVLGAIGFVVSDKPVKFVSSPRKNHRERHPLHGTRFVSFPVKHGDDDYFNNSPYITPKESNHLLEAAAKKLYRQNGWFYEDLNFKYDGFGKGNPSEKSRLNHPELSFYMHLCERDFIAKYVEALREELSSCNYGKTDGYRVYVVIIDIHSTHSLCRDCVELTHGLYPNSQNGKDESDDENSDAEDEPQNETSPFVNTLKEVLREKKFKVNRPLEVIVRHSSNIMSNRSGKIPEEEKNGDVFLDKKEGEKSDQNVKKKMALEERDLRFLAGHSVILNSNMQKNTLVHNLTFYVSCGEDEDELQLKKY